MSNIDKNVLIFGDSGSGKSSIVNLLLGKNEAAVSDKAVGCTFSYQKYETAEFNLFDTVGLSEGTQGTVTPESAIKALVNLLKTLKGGVSLLIYVIQKGRIKKSIEENYNLFVNKMCMNEVPVILVITHCEMDCVRGAWWTDNKTHFDEYRMSFKAVVSGTAAHPDFVAEIMRPAITHLNNETAEELLQAIHSNILAKNFTYKGGNWFQSVFIGLIQMSAEVVEVVKRPNIEMFLCKCFEELGFTSSAAHVLAVETTTLIFKVTQHYIQHEANLKTLQWLHL